MHDIYTNESETSTQYDERDKLRYKSNETVEGVKGAENRWISFGKRWKNEHTAVRP